MKQYSFLDENCMCSASLTSYESPATNNGTFEDVYCKNKKKPHKKHKRITIKNPMKEK